MKEAKKRANKKEKSLVSEIEKLKKEKKILNVHISDLENERRRFREEIIKNNEQIGILEKENLKLQLKISEV